MKKSIALLIALVAVFVSIAWSTEYPYRFGFLLVAIIFAIFALVLSLKKGEQQ